MGKEIHTLTAYKCYFKFMERNNPLKDEFSEAIKNEEAPDLSVEDFFAEYISKGHKFLYGENVDRVVRLKRIESVEQKSFFTRIHLVPRTGKQGIDITLINTKDLEKDDYNFGDDWSATYSHNIFAYQPKPERNSHFILMFHRVGGSGCKSVIFETANKVLKERGIRLNMEWVIPYNNQSNANIDVVPRKVNLLFQKDNNSPDPADHVRARKEKKVTIKELSLNLNATENSIIATIFKNLSLKTITKEEAFASIQSETSPEFNTAKVAVKIGKTEKMVSWDDFENLFDGFDITEKINRIKGFKGFVEALKECSDEYYMSMFGDDVNE